MLPDFAADPVIGAMRATRTNASDVKCTHQSARQVRQTDFVAATLTPTAHEADLGIAQCRPRCGGPPEATACRLSGCWVDGACDPPSHGSQNKGGPCLPACRVAGPDP